MSAKKALIAGVLGCGIVAGCGTSQVSSIAPATQERIQVRSIAMMPGGGLLADAVAVELSNRGFNIVDSATTTNLMVRLNMNELEVSQPQGLAKLRGQGIDAVLMVKSSGSYDGQPQSASARMTSTADGRLIAGTTWQNGFGGVAGSIADRVMRQGLSQAANQIANEITARIKT